MYMLHRYIEKTATKTSLASPGCLIADAYPLDKISESIDMDLHIYRERVAKRYFIKKAKFETGQPYTYGTTMRQC